MADRGPVVRTAVMALGGERPGRRTDHVAAEEPMEIRVAGAGQAAQRIAVTMRTPGHDFELAAGFLLTEGIVGGAADIAAIRYCVDPGVEQQHNVVTVDLRRPLAGDAVSRALYATSSCGICGKAALDLVETGAAPVAPGPVVAASVLDRLPTALAEGQRVFAATGGLHGAGLFTLEGQPVVVREDVGRHNAVDKVLGRALLDGATPLADRILMVSGRVSFEVVQKAAMAGVPIVCAVSAPTSLAVDAARRLHMTLVGFLREGRANVYAGTERIESAPGPRRGAGFAGAAKPGAQPLGSA
jgi:FdhD protein